MLPINFKKEEGVFSPILPSSTVKYIQGKIQLATLGMKEVSQHLFFFFFRKKGQYTGTNFVTSAQEGGAPNLVINISMRVFTVTEHKALNLGLNFVPTPFHDAFRTRVDFCS